MPPEKSKAIYIKVSPRELQAIRERMESVGIQNLSAYMLKIAVKNGKIKVFPLPVLGLRNYLRCYVALTSRL